jgi:hypothetical protein
MLEMVARSRTLLMLHILLECCHWPESIINPTIDITCNSLPIPISLCCERKKGLDPSPFCHVKTFSWFVPLFVFSFSFLPLPVSNTWGGILVLKRRRLMSFPNVRFSLYNCVCFSMFYRLPCSCP